MEMRNVYLTKGMALMALSLTVAACSNSIDDYTPPTHEEIVENAEKQLGITIDPNQDWKMTQEGSIAVTANAGIDATEVLILDAYPFGNANVKAFARTNVKEGETAELSYVVPKGTNSVYVACRNDKNEYRVKYVGVETKAISFVDTKQNAPKRAAVASPTVTEDDYTFNAKLARSWIGINAALATGTNYDRYFNGNVNHYKPWENSGWNDKYWTVNGSVVESAYTDDERNAIYNTLQTVIPESQDNYNKAVQTGYTIKTKGGPVTLTPIHAGSNSNDKISYYYYKESDGKPSEAQIKTMPKYTLGEMGGEIGKTYSLVYRKPNGECTYDFPEGYIINFVVSNTSQKGNKWNVYNSGGITTITGATEGSYELIDTWKPLFQGAQYSTGGYYNSSNSKSQLQFSTDWVNDVVYNFNKDKAIGGDSDFQYYTEGNGTNGSITDGKSTHYNIVPWFTGRIKVGVVLNSGKDFYIYDNGTVMSGYPIRKTDKYHGFFEFNVQENHKYTVLATGTKLGFYGYYCYEYKAGSAGTASTTNVVWDQTPIKPEYYADGALNQAVHHHTSGWGLNSSGQTTPAKQNNYSAAHNAVFSFNGKNYLGFEDWVDFDYNDLVFEIEGTTGGQEITVEKEIDNNTYTYAFEDTELGDYDMNDVVIRAQETTEGKIVLTVMAAGATLDLNIRLYPAATPQSGEVAHYAGQYTTLKRDNTNLDEIHAMFGVDNGAMVNTGAGPIQRPFTITIDKGDYDPSCLPLAIYAARTNREMKLAGSGSGAPYGIVIPVAWSWPIEYMDIRKAYSSNNDQNFSKFASTAGQALEWYKYPTSDRVMNESILNY